MIYFIGGAPRTGKSQLAKRLSKITGLSWLSTDNLRESVEGLEIIPRDNPLLRYWINWKKDNYLQETFSKPVEEMIEKQNIESKEVSKLVRSFVESINYNNRDFILEGVALLPRFYDQEFLNKFKVKFVCVGNTDYESFVKKSWEIRSEGDWLKDAERDVFNNTIKYCSKYGEIFKKEASDRSISYFEICSDSFELDIEKISKELVSQISST